MGVGGSLRPLLAPIPDHAHVNQSTSNTYRLETDEGIDANLQYGFQDGVRVVVVDDCRIGAGEHPALDNVVGPGRTV